MGILDLIKAAGGLIDSAIGILVGAALLVFLWGLAKFVFRVGGSEAKVEEGKNMMKWGLVALFIMVSLGGILYFFKKELGIGPEVPEINTPTLEDPGPFTIPEPTRGPVRWPRF